MLNDLIIRAEKPADYKNTELMAMRSFWNKYGPAADEHFLIRIIRESEDYIPEISRVAEYEGRIVGAVYYTRAWIVDGERKHEVVTFGPLAVEPTLEGHDIGGALMRETIKLAKDAGYAGIVLMGEPYYYPRFGFERGAKYGITDAEGNSFDALMCLPLNDDFSEIKGKLIESKDFDKLGDKERLAEIEGRIEQAKLDYEPALEAKRKIEEIDSLGKRNITGKVVLPEKDYNDLTALAKEGLTSRSKIWDMQRGLEYYRDGLMRYATRYENLRDKYEELTEKTRPFLDAMEHFPELVSAFVNKLKDLFRDKAAREQAERERQIAEREKHRAARKLARTDRELER